ncbi:MAG: restriction endonuclease subunit S [Veillonella parvula]|uniref:Restriction endonuclease subunit S n=1 Tax=Veillonella parvula TaxID=29466 RepID=A0A943A2U0_VEIPA|nr:restriction endonuclease subunit S [Veillonella parvula]MBS4892287.1 restriction endonuclease subunit S [Veillonella parvula]
MSKEKRRVPKLRFPGFTEDWEQRKLSDISTKVTTKNIDVHYTETLTNSAEQGIISQVDFFDKEISNKDNINGYYIVENNDFIYNPRISTLAPVGPINRNKLNRTGIMSPLYTVFRASNVDLDFLEWYFQSSHWHRYMKLNGDSGARADRIAIKDSTFFDMPIKTPVNIKEQVLIGETLEKFNQYITLHQRKLNNLKLKKKALLQKLFPKNGERYPELRFPGFTDAWEQRKLIYIFNDFIVPMRDKPKVFSGTTPWTRIEDIEGRYINTSLSGQFVSDETIKSMNLKVIPKGSLIVSASATFGVVAIVNNDLITNQTFIGLVPNKDFDIDFLYSLFEAPTTKGKLLKLSAGSTIFYIARESFENLVLSVPSKEEQIKISKVFKSIDDSITLHQRKLDHLQLQKKALLQQMFI